MGYQPTDQECRFCGEEAIQNGEIDAYCTNCGATTTAHKQTASLGNWAQFFTKRDTYPRSDRVICVGGFLQAYDWNNTDDGFRY